MAAGGLGGGALWAAATRAVVMGRAVGPHAAHAVAMMAVEASLTSSYSGGRRRLSLGLLLCYAGGGWCAGAEGGIGEAAAGSALRVMWWNARHLLAAAGSTKRAWLAEQLEAQRPAVVGLAEVDGNFAAMRKRLT